MIFNSGFEGKEWREPIFLILSFWFSLIHSQPILFPSLRIFNTPHTKQNTPARPVLMISISSCDGFNTLLYTNKKDSATPMNIKITPDFINAFKLISKLNFGSLRYEKLSECTKRRPILSMILPKEDMLISTKCYNDIVGICIKGYWQ